MLNEDIKKLKKVCSDLEHNKSILKKIDDILLTKKNIQLCCEFISNEITQYNISLGELNVKKTIINETTEHLRLLKDKINLEKNMFLFLIKMVYLCFY